MKRTAALLFFFVALNAFAQVTPFSLSKVVIREPFIPSSPILPVPGSKLNYTQVMFEHPVTEKAVYYVVNVFSVNGKDTVPFVSVTDSTNATMISGFGFGKEYAWNYVSTGAKKKKIATSPWYGFSILPLPEGSRIRVVKNDSAKTQGGLVSFDYAEVITGRDGKPVWFLPSSGKGDFVRDDEVRDLRISKAGTFTFITEKNAFEVSVDGRTMWKAPQNPRDTSQHYHHGFERLPNGNFMVMGNHAVMRKVPGDSTYVRIVFGTVEEFDRSGKMVWKWEAENYFTDADIFSRKTPDGKPDVSTHMNAFSVDDSMHFVYAGFRDMSRIVKVDYRTGKAVQAYGKRMPSGEAKYANGFYWHQHDASIQPDGTIAVFDNDSIADPGISSRVLIFSQPASPGDSCRIVWSFPCRFDSLSDGKSEKGGNIDLLPNGNYLINMGSLNRCIEVTKDGKVVWDVFEEGLAPDKVTWGPFRQYRSHCYSSLYPCYFTSNISGKISSTIPLVINNEGTESDSYIVECKQKDGTWMKVAGTQQV
ncbi:MAG TPA: aryl-sulfate sulfotransferase, partial [Bacteroidia bacterium]|nr:aryl-sulfate sulfotransferase [Bacteroidia bacterium]